MATMILSAGNVKSSPVLFTDPSSCNSCRVNVNPSTISEPVTSFGAAKNSKWTPSSFASSNSDGFAGICSSPRRYVTVTLSAPRRTQVRAASIATLPAPMMRTLSPLYTGINDSSALPFCTNCTDVNNAIACNIPALSSPGKHISIGTWVPVAIKIASKPSSNRASKLRSGPIVTLHSKVTPNVSKRFTSRRTISLPKRNSGIPNNRIPPGSSWRSNTVTS